MLRYIKTLQTALKLLAGDEEELLQIIPVLIGCTREDIVEENSIKPTIVRDVLGLMKETAFSHLMEVNNLLVRFVSTILL
jgi:nucleolar protein 9